MTNRDPRGKKVRWYAKPCDGGSHQHRWHALQGLRLTLVPVRAQELSVLSSTNFTRTGLPQANDFQMISDRLILEFQLLFLRAPRQNTNEGDLLPTAQHLRIWPLRCFYLLLVRHEPTIVTPVSVFTNAASCSPLLSRTAVCQIGPIARLRTSGIRTFSRHSAANMTLAGH